MASACDLSWNGPAVFYSAICIAVRFCEKGAEMDLIALLEVMKWFTAHSDELRLSWQSAFLHFLLSCGTPGRIAFIWIGPGLQIHQRSMKLWMAPSHCPSLAGNPAEIKIASDRSVVKFNIGQWCHVVPSKCMFACVCVYCYVLWLPEKATKWNGGEYDVKVVQGENLLCFVQKVQSSQPPQHLMNAWLSGAITGG